MKLSSSLNLTDLLAILTLWLSSFTRVSLGRFRALITCIRIPSTCRWSELLEALSTQVCLPADLIEYVSVNEAVWPPHSDVTIGDGDHCQVAVSRLPVSALDWPGDSCRSLCPHDISIVTFFADLNGVCRRFDGYGASDLDLVICHLNQLDNFKHPLVGHLVPWDPNHLEPCRKLFIVTEDLPVSELVPMLVVLDLPDLNQAWQVDSFRPSYLGLEVLARFPESRKFNVLANGRCIHSAGAAFGPGSCIVCEVIDSETASDPFDFSEGMQALISWISIPSGVVDSPIQQRSVGTGDAPCPCDRWCADPLTSDIPASSSHDHDGKDGKVVTLALEAVLPLTQVPAVLPVPVPLILTVDFGTRLRTMQCCLHKELPEGMQIHRSTAIEFLQRSDPECGDSPDQVWRHELYIDGSASTDHCAWAVVHVTRHHSGQRRFVGLLAGNVHSRIAGSALDWCPAA